MKKLIDVDAEDVVAAYRNTKLQPCIGNIIPDKHGQCCGLGALLVGDVLAEDEVFENRPKPTEQAWYWGIGFDRGLTGSDINDDPYNAIKRKGYKIGQQVKKEFFPDEYVRKI